MKNKTKVTLIFFVVLILLAASYFKFSRGYWPFPYFSRVLYYHSINDSKRLAGSTIDNDFKFQQEGYSITGPLESIYPLRHSVNLIFNLKDETIPKGQNFHGSYEIELFKKDQLVYTETLDKFEYLLTRDNYDEPLTIYGIHLGKVPFPIEGEVYKNLKLKITVIKPDQAFTKYTDSASIKVFPDIVIE